MKDMREKSRYINANLQMLISRFLSRWAHISSAIFGGWGTAVS
jgi:hypothetical protein